MENDICYNRFKIISNWFGIIVHITKTRLYRDFEESIAISGNRIYYYVSERNLKDAIKKFREFYINHIQQLIS